MFPFGLQENVRSPQPDRTFGHMDLNYFSFAAEVRLTMGNNYRDL
ncbi:hypothetical protein MCC10114_2057 [Bifidobacterium longum subsp. longum]|nr:hypothetical protein MCC10114_2057 [Bifidobacterium longum subsp. longum]